MPRAPFPSTRQFQKEVKMLKEKGVYLTHGFFESRKVNVSSHIPKGIPFGIKRDCVLEIIHGGMHTLC